MCRNENLKTVFPVMILLVLSLLLLSACSGDDDNDGNSNNSEKVLSLDMQIPASLTGGGPNAVVSPLGAVVAAQSDVPCQYLGPENEDDPFRNGYEMTKFMVSVVATWTCITETIVELSGYVPHDGLIKATENELGSEDYEPEDPTHYSVVDESETQTTVRLYYGYDRFVPPLADEDPQFYISWNKSSELEYEGRIVIDGLGINDPNRKVDDPINMRMDFNFGTEEKLVDMYLQFDGGNEWADGFRIQVRKDLTAPINEQVFTARGIINMKRQFIEVPGVSELPSMRMYTVSDQFGEGAAIAQYDDVGIPLILNVFTGNHLGNYIFDKVDRYYFDENPNGSQPWDYINKTFSFAELRGGRTTPTTGGTWDPFDPSLDLIASALELPEGYFTANQCELVGDDCVELLNAVFEDGFAGQEPNQGSNPNDWRSNAVDMPDYLQTVYPNGVDWTGAFDFEFSPSL